MDPVADASVDRRLAPRGSRWSRTDVNFLLDCLLLVLFVSLSTVAVVVRFVFPPATVADGYSLWGLGYDAWRALEFGILATLALVVLIHVMLHWNWVCNVIATRTPGARKGKVDEGIMTIYGVGLLISLATAVGLVVAAAALSVKGP